MANDKDSAVLLPCPVPWCGSPDAKALSFDANRRRHWIECGKCNFKTPQMPSRAKVITLWNTRQPTQSDALREAVEKERAAIVAWLLECMELYISRGLDTYVALEDIAHNIERGEHHGAPPE